MEVPLPGPAEDGSVCIAGGREGQSFQWLMSGVWEKVGYKS